MTQNPGDDRLVGSANPSIECIVKYSRGEERSMGSGRGIG